MLDLLYWTTRIVVVVTWMAVAAFLIGQSPFDVC